MLPAKPTPAPGERSREYGARLLCYLLDTACTATLTDDDLELADHVAVYAVTAPDISPVALANISTVRHLVRAMLTHRRQAAPAATSATTAPAETPNLGPMAPLAPVPVRRPPSGQHATIDF